MSLIKKRECGVLAHITSLPSPYGIGSFGKNARDFVDWLKSCGQNYWQVLPLSPTGYGNSPYQSFSTFAGNPLLIDLEDLVKRGLLSADSCKESDYEDSGTVDFERVYKAKLPLLEEAFDNFEESEGDVQYLSFLMEEADWLDDYALFMAIKEDNGNRSWLEWSERELRLRAPRAVDTAREKYFRRIEFWKFVQFTFFRQWVDLKVYANANGIKIIGDIPIYVAGDSSDVWASPNLFLLDGDGAPLKVAGVPPDYFSPTGQLWGNPLYDWEAMKKEKYSWWIERIAKAAKMYDTVRIDHFRAFDTYYAIPAKDKTAENGEWLNGPGMDLFREAEKVLGVLPIIAEDLGEIFDSVRKLLADSGFPGMKVLQFAFNSENSFSPDLPFNYPENSVAYTGTHDNSTVKGWYKEAGAKTRRNMKNYIKPLLFEGVVWAMIRTLYASSSGLVIIPLQDLLELPDSARMNIPSTLGNNWQWRLQSLGGSPAKRAAKKLRELGKTYFRGSYN
ncbi:4-alpha-glucanotransferase [Clostridia bacterium]|nr:4-alpha-glucanotransferase [Clostridia bacterium]